MCNGPARALQVDKKMQDSGIFKDFYTLLLKHTLISIYYIKI